MLEMYFEYRNMNCYHFQTARGKSCNNTKNHEFLLLRHNYNVTIGRKDSLRIDRQISIIIS